MATTVNNENLASYISELQALYRDVSSDHKMIVDQGENGGRTITQVVTLEESLQKMQDAFVLLVSNTVSYMSQRVISVETKETKATEEVKQ